MIRVAILIFNYGEIQCMSCHRHSPTPSLLYFPDLKLDAYIHILYTVPDPYRLLWTSFFYQLISG